MPFRLAHVESLGVPVLSALLVGFPNLFFNLVVNKSGENISREVTVNQLGP